jgi:hypothetical protein
MVNSLWERAFKNNHKEVGGFSEKIAFIPKPYGGTFGALGQAIAEVHARGRTRLPQLAADQCQL